MTIPNWTDLTLYHYLSIGGGALILLALLLYFTPISRLKLPGILVGIFGGLIAGTALGVIGMAYNGYRLEKEEALADRAPAPSSGGRPDAKMGGGRGGGGGGNRAGGMGGARGASPRLQLVTLIYKLDTLTHKPLAVTLSSEQKKSVRELIQKLDEQKELTDDEAKVKVEEIKKILSEEQRKTLASAGYRWPGERGEGPWPMGSGYRGSPGPQGNNPNPFTNVAEDGEHLKSLRAQLEDKADAVLKH